MQKIVFLFIISSLWLTIFAQSNSYTNDSVSLKNIAKQKIDQQIFAFENIKQLPLLNKIIEKKESNIKTSYIFLFFLNLAFIAVLLSYTFRDKIKKLIDTMFSINILTQYTKTEQKRDNRYLWFYLVLVLLVFMLFFYIVSLSLNFDINIQLVFIYLVCFFSIDLIIHKTSAYLFTINESIYMIHFNNFSFLLIVLPLLLLSILLTLFIHIESSFLIQYIIFAVLLLLYFWKELRNLFILKSFRINIYSFYFFLYLCTFKVAPLVIFSKIIFSEILKNSMIN